MATTLCAMRLPIASAALDPGAVIRFNSSVFNDQSPNTILLNSDQLEVPGSANGLFIDASDITGGVTIDANGTEANSRRIMAVRADATTALQNLILTGGALEPSAVDPLAFGGAILNENASLTITACHITQNSAGNGGAIYNGGLGDSNSTLVLHTSTFSNNTASFGGGAIVNGGNPNGAAQLFASSCTFSQNSGGEGGAIFNDGREAASAILSLDASTLTENTASSGGGGIFTESQANSSLLILRNTIVAGNASATGPDIFQEGSGTLTNLKSQNLIGNNGGSAIAEVPGLIGTSVTPIDPKLLPLGDYGGPILTTLPQPDSPAVNAGSIDEPGGTDQRGFPRFSEGALDIGAVEYRGIIDLIDFTFDLDSDSDGSINGLELAIGTDPFVADPENARNLCLTGFNEAGQPTLTFGVNTVLQSEFILRLIRSTDLITFQTFIISNADDFFEVPETGLLTIEDTEPLTGDGSRAFYRLEALIFE